MFWEEIIYRSDFDNELRTRLKRNKESTYTEKLQVLKTNLTANTRGKRRDFSRKFTSTILTII